MERIVEGISQGRPAEMALLFGIIANLGFAVAIGGAIYLLTTSLKR